MPEEYIRLDPSIRAYGKKTMLYCEMDLLAVLKRYEKYKKIREDELILKKALRKSILELKEILRKLSRDIPEIKENKFKPVEISKERKKHDELEDEISEIKRRISEISE